MNRYEGDDRALDRLFTKWVAILLLAAVVACVLLGTRASAQGCGPSNPNCIVPTAPPGTSNNQAASTAFVQNALSSNIPLPSGKIFIGSAGNVATAQTVSGDCSLSIAGVIICTKTNGTSFAPIATSGSAADLSTGTLPAGRMPALTGDVTSVAGALATTLATVNSNVGTFGSATQCVTVTTNGKGLITAANAATCTPAFSSITGTIAASQLPAGVSANVLNTQTANYSIATTDCGKTVQLGTGSTGQFTLTIPATAGFAATCVVDVVNGDTVRGKLLTGLSTSLPAKLYPRQSFTIKVVNGNWAVTKAPGRWIIPGAVTLFVDPAGSDSNDCLASGTANACLTLAGAMADAISNIDEAGVGGGLTFQLACGTYTASGGDMVHYSGRQVGAQGGGAITILGCDGVAEDTLLSVTSGSVFSFNTGAIAFVKNLAVATTTSGDCIGASDLTKVYLFNISFHACAGNHISAQNQSIIEVDANLIIAGGAGVSHINVGSSSTFQFNATSVSFTANATFGTAFAIAQQAGSMTYAATFTLNAHTVTGPRFLVQQNGIIVTGSGGNLNFFPGSTAGSTATGGQYDAVAITPSTQGGTGLATLTAHAVMLGEGAGNVGFASVGTAGFLLIDQGAGVDPAFTAMSGDATIAGTGVLTLGTNVVSNAKFRQGIARSLVGVTGNATANTADIQGTANQIPIVNNAGTALAFTTVSGDLTNATGVFTIANGAVSNAKLASAATTVAGATCTLGSTCGLSTVTNSLGGDVAMNNTANYFDGPSVAQGTSGTWWASGTVTLSGSVNDFVRCKLWDGTTIMSSAVTSVQGTVQTTLSLSGYLASPAANIRISCRDTSNTTGLIQFNQGNSKDSTLSAIRIN
jgi:hypothetical protein